jgi:LPS export ABC transporter protein LptC
VAAALAALLAAHGALTGCSSRRTSEEDPRQGEVAQPEQISRGFELTQTERGRVEWTLRAESGEIYEGGDSVDLVEPVVDFFDSLGAKEGTLTADRGRIRDKEEIMEVDGNVVLLGEEGARLATSHLVWENRGNRITTDAFVTLERKGSTLSGYGLVATPDLKVAEVQRDVRISGEREEP